MKAILVKAAAATALSVVASLALAMTIVPALGGVVDGNAWLMCILIPLVVAFPASGYTFWQNQRIADANAALNRALEELAETHEKLSASHRQLAEKACRDDMTGLLNRSGFFEAVHPSINGSAPGVLLVMDADNFKAINDNFGHHIGDEALRCISLAIAGALRPKDILGRIGGEEFAAFLPDMGPGPAATIAERIRNAVEALEFMAPDGTTITLTISIGGAEYREGVQISSIMREADRRLYSAKRTGRNRVVFPSDGANTA
ncbi:MAG: GGDEF domain-containing protein [Phyllobacterium sp.]